MKDEFEDFEDHSISKFESMLKTNSFLFFDSNEFEEIVVYYLEIGNVSLAKKAISLAIKQYPDSITLSLLHIEILLLNNEIEMAFNDVKAILYSERLRRFRQIKLDKIIDKIL